MAREAAPIDWHAKWIWTPGRTSKPFHFSYFRKTFQAPAGRAKVHCAADSKYRLWVNGRYVGFGPARGHAERPYYDTRTVDLKAGANTVAFLVEHYSSPPAIFGAVRGGLICQVRAGRQVLAATDRSWRALPARAYRALDGYLYPECFDASLEPPGWELPGFADADWPMARELSGTKLAAPAALRPRPIPITPEVRVTPRTLLDAGSCRDERAPDLRKELDVAESLWRCRCEPARGGLFRPELTALTAWPGKPVEIRLRPNEAAYLAVDFGKEVLASPEVSARSPAGVICDLGYSECLAGNRVATRWQGVRLSERIILREGHTRHRINQPRGFRYLMLRVANAGRSKACRVVLEDLCAHEAIYPTRPRGQFRCSDPLLDDIFRLAARTVNLCMEDAFTDCPWRERAQWLGDVQPEALFSYYCFGAYDLARKAALEYATGHTPEGWIPGVFPTSRPGNLPTWGMRFPVIAWEYYLHTADRSALPTLHAGARRQMEWLRRHEDGRGLLVDLPGWRFVDWTALDSNHNDGAVQGWYLEALECSAKLARAAGDAAAADGFARRAGRLRKSLARVYWSDGRQAFLKYRPNSPIRPPQASADLIGQHENFLFPLLKVGTPAMRRKAIQAVAGAVGRFLPDLGDYQSCHFAGQGGNYAGESVVRIGSPFWSYYALLALLEAGRVREALEYMRICWGLMLDNGATSCWEMWDRHSSLCHGWSAAPAMILPAYVLGVRPVAPGFARFEVRPHPGDLAWARGRVPTPHGAVAVSWRRRGEGGLVCRVRVPAGTRGKFVAPKGPPGRPAVTLDGNRLPTGGAVALAPGRHVIQIGR